MNVALVGLSNFSYDQRDKKLEFLDLALPGKRFVDQSMLFTQFYLMQGEKIEAWFLSQANRKYFGVETTAFLSATTFTKKSTHWR